MAGYVLQHDRDVIFSWLDSSNDQVLWVDHFKTVKFINHLSQLSIIANYQLVAMELRIGVYIYIYINVIYNHARE